MKKVLVLLSLVATVTAFSQGTVNFQNRNTTVTPNIVAPITYAAGGPATAGAINGATPGSQWSGVNARAGLYGGPEGTGDADLVLLTPAVGFRTGAASGYVNVGSAAARTFPATGPAAVAPGARAVVVIRAWDVGQVVDTYEAARAIGVGYFGSSVPLTITTGGAGAPPGPPADLIGLAPFSINYVPEPSIIGLGILGAIAGLMVFRRRS